MVLPGTLFRIVKDRPFILGTSAVDAYRGELVVFLCYLMYHVDYMHVYFLPRGQVVREGARMFYNANDLELVFDACVEDMEEA